MSTWQALAGLEPAALHGLLGYVRGFAVMRALLGLAALLAHVRTTDRVMRRSTLLLSGWRASAWLVALATVPTPCPGLVLALGLVGRLGSVLAARASLLHRLQRASISVCASTARGWNGPRLSSR